MIKVSYNYPIKKHSFQIQEPKKYKILLEIKIHLEI